MKIFLLILISIMNIAVGQDECVPTRCEPSGPLIRFPFRLKDRQPDHCGYPGFDLSCNQSGRTELNLQFMLTTSTNSTIVPLQMSVIVWNIDYEGQKMLAGNARARSCLPEKIRELNSSASLFEVEAIGNGDGYTLFNCSNTPRSYETIPCLSSRKYQVIPFSSGSEITSLLPHSSCFKMYSISYVPDGALTGRDDEFGTRFYLRWSRPSCGKCEAQRKYCRSRNGQETECFSSQRPQHGGISRKHKPLVVGGIILLAFITVASIFILRAMKRKKDEHKRIEKVLANHKDMRPRRYSYADIKRSRNNLKEKLHKGTLSDGTPVAVKMLNGCEQSIEDFISEVERIGRMQDTNVLQLIGYCLDGRKRALVYESLQSGILETLISSDKQRHTLGWARLYQIALGIAKGVDYLHNQQILNLHISPQTIMLDHNFNPKILVPADQGEIAYIAPELLDVFSQKANVYSLGMLLLNITGRSLNGGEKESCEVYFPDWFYNQITNGDGEAIHVEEEEKEIVQKLSIIGLCCIQWFPSDRPSMKAVIQMLEGDKMPAIPPNPFVSVDPKTQN